MSSEINPMKIGESSDSPLDIIQPMNIAIFLSFFSPVILAISITSLSFIFQNFKGLIYLGFLISFCVVRNFCYIMSGSSPMVNDKTICTAIQYSKYGNPTFSSFVFAFTIIYLSLPMFINKAVNYWIFLLLIIYFFADMFIKIYKKCIVKTGELFLNVLLGAASSSLIVSLMYFGGSGKYLFFNEVSSNKDVCYQPSKQTFRCKLFKDGTLVGSL